MNKTYSHNDYWAKNKIKDAMEKGLFTFEADIIYVGGKIMLSHSWRPTKSLCHGTLEEEYLQPLNVMADGGIKTTLIIEPKSVCEEMLEDLYDLLLRYKHENLTYVTGVQYKYLHQHHRLVWMYDFHLMCMKRGFAVETYDKRLRTKLHDQVNVYPEYNWFQKIIHNQF